MQPTDVRLGTRSLAAAVFAAVAVAFALLASLPVYALCDPFGPFELAGFSSALGLSLLFTVPGAALSGFLNADWLRDATASDPSWTGATRRGAFVALVGFAIDVVSFTVSMAAFESSLSVALNVLALSLTIGIGFLILSLPFGVAGSVLISRLYRSRFAQAA